VGATQHEHELDGNENTGEGRGDEMGVSVGGRGGSEEEPEREGAAFEEDGPQEAPAAQKEGAAVAVAGEPEEGESWLAEGVEDAKAVVSAAADLVPGPRVGSSSLPWALAVPLAYLGLTFVLAVVKTVRKMNSPAQNGDDRCSTGTTPSLAPPFACQCALP